MIIYIEHREDYVVLRARAEGDGIVGDLVRYIHKGESATIDGKVYSYGDLICFEGVLEIDSISDIEI